jgi:hypothetical protein
MSCLTGVGLSLTPNEEFHEDRSGARATGRASPNRLHTYATWAEIVAAVAVVVSLVFVGVQVRQSTAETVLSRRVAEATAYLNLQQQLAVVTTVQIENPDLRRVMSRVSNGETLDSPDDEDDQRLYLAFARLIIRLGDLAYPQRQSEVIDDARLVSMLSPLRVEVLGSPLGRSIWESMRSSLVPEFVDYVEQTLLGGLRKVGGRADLSSQASVLTSVCSGRCSIEVDPSV